MNDLLGGSGPPGRGRSSRYKAPADVEDEDLEAGPPPPPPTDEEQSMQHFFKIVEELKADMAEIKVLQREVTTLNEKGKTIVKTKEVQRHQEEMQVCDDCSIW